MFLDSSLKDSPYFEELKNITFKKAEGLRLVFESEVLKILSDGGESFSIDFLKESYIKEVKQNYARKESVFSFLKQIKKYNKNEEFEVLDLTAGSGRDLFKFVYSGCKVLALERNPVLYYLLKDGLRRFLDSDKKQELQSLFRVEKFKLELRHLDAAQLSLNDKEPFDLVYYDPMFSDDKKKAAPKKHMQMLKSLSSKEDWEEKYKIINKFLQAEPKAVDYFFLKSSRLPSSFPFKLLREIKGKGYSYYHLAK